MLRLRILLRLVTHAGPLRTRCSGRWRFSFIRHHRDRCPDEPRKSDSKTPKFRFVDARNSCTVYGICGGAGAAGLTEASLALGHSAGLSFGGILLQRLWTPILLLAVWEHARTVVRYTCTRVGI